MDLNDLTRGWRPYGLYGAALLLAIVLYVPFRLVASHTNAVPVAAGGGFIHPSAAVVWPLYVLLAVGIVYFTSGALGFSLVPDLFALAFLLTCSDLASHLDRLLGLTDRGGVGFLKSINGQAWNSTWTSQELCFVAIPLALIVGKTVGILLVRGRIELKAPGERPDWRTIAAHVLNAGFAAPALAWIFAASILGGPMGELRIRSAGAGFLALAFLALGLAGGMAFAFARVVRDRKLHRPERSALVASIIYGVLALAWGALTFAIRGWGVPGRVVVCLLTLGAIFAFVAHTRQRFGAMGAGSTQETH